MKNILEMQNVTKKINFKGKDKEILHQTNFSVQRGKFISIIGPSGSGKTTFLTTLGILQENSTGNIKLNGKDISLLNEKQKSAIRFNNFGFILQSSNLIPFLNLNEQFKLIDKLNKNKKELMNKNELLNMLDIKHLLNSYPSDMSGGEKQRSAIARALYNNPDIVLADEPTASLDNKRTIQVVKLLKDISHNLNKSVIMITHDNRLLKYVDEYYIMDDGYLSEKKYFE